MINQLNSQIKQLLSIMLRIAVWITFTLILNHIISNGLPKFFWDSTDDWQTVLAWLVILITSFMGMLRIIDHIQKWFAK